MWYRSTDFIIMYRSWSFFSNRLFDVFAACAFVISDNIRGSKEVFGESLVTYETKDELKLLIEKYIEMRA